MIKALILDIDGTLLAKDQCIVEKSTIKAINLAKEKGIKIIIATGRGYSFLQQDIKDSIKPDLYVCCNGGAINDCDGKILVQKPLDNETIDKFISYCDLHNYSYGFKCADDFVVYNDYPYFVGHYCTKAILKENIHDYTNDKTFHLTKAPVVAYVFFRKDIDPKEFVNDFPECKWTFWSADHSEGTKIDVNKAVTVKQALKMLDLTMDQAICFGDGDNDIEMLQQCKIGVAMGNSKDSVKQHADYVCGNINEDGIYNCLKNLKII